MARNLKKDNIKKQKDFQKELWVVMDYVTTSVTEPIKILIYLVTVDAHEKQMWL